MGASARGVLLAASVLLGGCRPVASPPTEPLPEPSAVRDSDYTKLLGQSVGVIREALQGDVGRRQAYRAAAMAVLIAAHAQQDLSGKDAGLRATVRDAALQVADLIAKKDYAGALLLAETLPNLPADPMAKKERLPLPPESVTYMDLMKLYGHEDRGGLGYEDLFTSLGGSPNEMVPAKALTEGLLVSAFHSAATAELIAGHVPSRKVDEWRMSSADMRKESLDLAAAVKAKDGKAAFQAVDRLNRACNRCHQAFRAP